jgi:pimeloyl-ACP methyl ester carboxylesterase
VLISSTGGSSPDRPKKPPQFDFAAALPANNVYGDLQSTLPRLKAPTLLIWGSKDPIMEEDMRQSLRTALPAAQVKIFDGLGHNPFWDDPRGVAEAVDTFLNAPL